MKGLWQADSELIKQRTAALSISLDLKYEHESTHRIYVSFIGTANPHRTLLSNDSMARDRFMTLELSAFRKEKVSADLAILGIELNLNERPIESITELCREHLWACVRYIFNENSQISSSLGYLPLSVRGMLEERTYPWVILLDREIDGNIRNWQERKKELRINGLTDLSEGYSYAEIRQGAELRSARDRDISAVLHKFRFRHKKVGEKRLRRCVPSTEEK